jgi:hypothetical protein
MSMDMELYRAGMRAVGDGLMECAPEVSSANHLSEWITGAAGAEYLGDAASLKLDVAAAVFYTGESLASVARRHGKKRSAAHNQAVRLRKIFGMSPPPMDEN